MLLFGNDMLPSCRKIKTWLPRKWCLLRIHQQYRWFKCSGIRNCNSTRFGPILQYAGFECLLDKVTLNEKKRRKKLFPAKNNFAHVFLYSSFFILALSSLSHFAIINDSNEQKDLDVKATRVKIHRQLQSLIQWVFSKCMIKEL